MKALLTLHARKIGGNRTFWVMLIAHVGLLILLTFLLHNFAQGAMGSSALPLADFFNFPGAWQNLAMIGKASNYLFCFLVVHIVANDLEHRLLRQHISDGLSREQVWAGYLLVAAFFASFSLALILILGLLFGVQVPGQSVITGESLALLGAFWLQSYAFFTFTLMVALLVGRAVAALGMLVIWHLIAEPLGSWALGRYVGKAWEQVLPFRVIGDLLPSPSFMTMGIAKAGVDPKIAMYTLVYTALFGFIVWAKLRFSDL